MSYTNREIVLIRIALWVILIGFIVGIFLEQTSPFIAIASFFAIALEACIRNDTNFTVKVVASALQSVVICLALGLYWVL